MKELDIKEDLERDADINDTSIATSELCSILMLIKRKRNSEIEFYDLINRAMELQTRLYEMEMKLKRELRKKEIQIKYLKNEMDN